MGPIILANLLERSTWGITAHIFSYMIRRCKTSTRKTNNKNEGPKEGDNYPIIEEQLKDILRWKRRVANHVKNAKMSNFKKVKIFFKNINQYVHKLWVHVILPNLITFFCLFHLRLWCCSCGFHGNTCKHF